jgi:hypothetical protein
MSEKYKATLDLREPVIVANSDHADTTSWCYSPDDDAYLLALHRANGECFGVACYKFEDWLDTFERLKSAHAARAGVSTNWRDAGYRDASFPERRCERCNRPYRGPALYCSFDCAEADA